ELGLTRTVCASFGDSFLDSYSFCSLCDLNIVVHLLKQTKDAD
nr:hypothetical protein [Tanacetum cinerariifolium]